MYIFYNPNPKGSNIGDCVIRALTKACDMTWDDVYLDLMLLGFAMKDMPSANHVWGTYLMQNGFQRFALPNTCPDCYSISDFCNDHPKGTYVLATGSHVITTIDGNYYDSWDSGREVPAYLFAKGDK